MERPVHDLRVAVVHGPQGQLRPVWFDLNHRQHRIVEITNSWRERRGQTHFRFFHVSDGGALYELTYCTSSGQWSLQHIEALN